MLACINSYFIDTYFGTYCQSNSFQNRLLKTNTSLKKILIPTSCHSKSRIPMVWSRRQNPTQRGLPHNAKRESSANNQEPKREILQVTAQDKLHRNGAVRAGVGKQPWHKEALRVHIWAAHTQGKESWWFCMQHLVIMKVIKITRFTRLAVCNCCTYKCSVSLLRLIQIIQPPWACKPELQVWIWKGIY